MQIAVVLQLFHCRRICENGNLFSAPLLRRCFLAVRILVDVHDESVRQVAESSLLPSLRAYARRTRKVLYVTYSQSSMDGLFDIGIWLYMQDAVCVALLVGIAAALTQSLKCQVE